jgi:hypothetical protein
MDQVETTSTPEAITSPLVVNGHSDDESKEPVEVKQQTFMQKYCSGKSALVTLYSIGLLVAAVRLLFSYSFRLFLLLSLSPQPSPLTLLPAPSLLPRFFL